VKRFGYIRDPLCLLCCALYATNRWIVKPHLHVPFFQFWFNDALLIPCALPVALWVQRWLNLRSHDRAPSAGEIFAHLAGWSILFEVIGPRIMPHATGDAWDVVAYAAGALVSFVFWRWRERDAGAIAAG